MPVLATRDAEPIIDGPPAAIDDAAASHDDALQAVPQVTEGRRDRLYDFRLPSAILLVYMALSTVYNVVIPVGEAPDEPSHVDYVQTVLRTGQLPTIPKGSARYSYEAEQPPLYYLLQAAWIGILPPHSNLLPHLEAKRKQGKQRLAGP